MERRLEILLTSPAFSNLVSFLDTLIWQIDDENFATFGENQILKFSNSFNIYHVQTEWDRLKNYVRYILEKQPQNNLSEYMEKIFTNSTISEECKNVLHIFEILLVTTFTNAKVEQVFSGMSRIKTDWRKTDWNKSI